jgi:DNA transformation protein
MATEHSITPSRPIRRSSKPKRSSEPQLSVLQVDATTALAAVANLGPKSARALVLAGVSSFAELSRLGSVRAYAKVKQQQPSVTLNLLWALEGAISRLPWQTVAKEHRTSLLLALEQYQNGG